MSTSTESLFVSEEWLVDVSSAVSVYSAKDFSWDGDMGLTLSASFSWRHRSLQPPADWLLVKGMWVEPLGEPVFLTAWLACPLIAAALVLAWSESLLFLCPKFVVRFSLSAPLWRLFSDSRPDTDGFRDVWGTMKPSGCVMGYSKKCPFPIKGLGDGKVGKSTAGLRLGLESDRRLSTLKGLSFWMVEALPLELKFDCWLLSDESSSDPLASWVGFLWFWCFGGVWSQLDCVWFRPPRSQCRLLCSLSVTCDTPLSLSDPGVWNNSPAKSLFCDLRSLFSCFRFFFSILSSSLRAISSGSMGSPLQVVGWELCAGRPGPFFVFSFFLHLALRFWNQTYTPKKSNIHFHFIFFFASR